MTDWTVETYNKIAEHYNKSHGDPVFWAHEFEIFKGLIHGKKAIDIGCGAGRDAVLFAENKFDYTGIDASKGMLEISRSKVPSGKFIQMSFYDIKLPKESFDGFWAAASLLHIPKGTIHGVLLSIRKILKHGGIGFISMKEKTEMEEGVIREEKYGGIERYFSFYTIQEFSDKLKRSGFEVLKTHTKIEHDGTNWLCFFVKKI